MGKEVITIPDLGGVSDVEVVEIVATVGDQLQVDDILIVLESDKASMEIPCPLAGTLLSLAVSEGDSVAEGDPLATLEVGAAAAETPPPPAPEPASPSAPVEAPAAPEPAGSQLVNVQVIDIKVPDLGGVDDVEVIELSVKAGDEIAEEESLMVVESDKASMEVPSPAAGTVIDIALKVGDSVGEGDLILTLETSATAQKASALTAAAPEPAAPALGAAPPRQTSGPAPASAPMPTRPDGERVHAGPAVRKIAREFGVQLGLVTGSGPRGRILKENVQAFVKKRLQQAPGAGAAGAGIPPIADIDFAQFGPVRVEPMSKLHRITAENMHRSWLNVPRVTQFDDADITELERFRAEVKAEAQTKGVKLTPLPFLLKACALALVNNPSFNASLHSDGERIIYKDYVHIGMAVATPAGLMVPVIRDVDKKGLYELAAESMEMAQKAKDRKLKPQQMQGGCFTISSLGGLGGTGFTPVVNAPEVAILGVSKLTVKPVWEGGEFVPRKMLPLALAYDHRAVNGAAAGRFMTELVALLSDIRRLLL